ncbi:MAG: L-ascorbate 6-phosphate lactonase, partial [Actinomycetota bacterium]
RRHLGEKGAGGEQVGGKFVFPDNKDDMEYHYDRGFDDVFTKETDLPFPSCWA